MASPVVAGAAALILARNPALTPVQVQLLLQQTADDIAQMVAEGPVNRAPDKPAAKAG